MFTCKVVDVVHQCLMRNANQGVGDSEDVISMDQADEY